MKKVLIITIFASIFSTAYSSEASKDVFKGIIRFEEFEKLMNQKDDVLYVVNFWATWCGPCVSELPDFMQVNNQLAERNDYKMILVSLDDKRGLASEVIPFLNEHQITADVYLLDDVKRMNYWMPKVHRGWSGSIPATVFYRNGKRLQFVEKQLYKKELFEIINQYISL
jgi:thiol-disulfide isomerase/thioredoxin